MGSRKYFTQKNFFMGEDMKYVSVPLRNSHNGVVTTLDYANSQRKSVS